MPLNDETSRINLGAIVISAACQLWAGPGEAVGALGSSLVAIFSGKLKSATAGRSAARAFEEAGDRVARELETFYLNEFGGLAENEMLAAQDGVRQVMESFDTSKAAALLDIDVDSENLVLLLTPTAREVVKHLYLSTAATSYFWSLLRECSTYVVEVFTSMPQFASRAAVELLQRSSTVIDKIDEVLARLPQSDHSGAHRTFDRDYRRALAKSLDWMQLHGLDLPSKAQRYALSVSYIQLALTRQTRDELVDAESAFSCGNRFVILGDAGSGKTTLLQWLAVRAARQELPEALYRWQRRIPFLVRLRRYADADLPNLEDLLESSAPALAGRKPASWVTSHFVNGSILLVDGADEFPASRQQELVRWLQNIDDAYPETIIAISTRPTAIPHDWLSTRGYEHFRMSPLAMADALQLIDQWHTAVLEGSFTLEAEERVQARKTHIRDAIRHNPSLRNLSSSPLLCAMLCGLNLERNGPLPEGRTALYEMVLSSFISRRDSERGVALPFIEGLGDRQTELLLQDIAFWQLMNGLIEVDVDRVRNRLTEKLRNFPSVKAPADEVLRQLLERTGLLRRLPPSHMSFVHRTFLEFLAARELLAQDLIEHALGNAERDDWREVIILASGIATLKQRTSLLSELLGLAEGSHASHNRRLLAVACMQTAVEIAPHLQAPLAAAIEQLVPPGSADAQEAIVQSGDTGASMLTYDSRWSAEEIVRSIDVLGRVGTDLALDVLSGYVTNTDEIVRDRLVNAWRNFDPVKYATQILSEMRLDRVEVRYPEQAGACRLLSDTQVEIRLNRGSVGAHDLQGCNIVSFDVSNNPDPIDLQCLEGQLSVETVNIADATNLRGAASIQRLASLKELTMTLGPGTTQLVLSGYNEWRNLASLKIREIGRNSTFGNLPQWQFFSLIESVPNLEELELPSMLQIHNLEWLSSARKLRRLHVARCNFNNEAEVELPMLQEVNLEQSNVTHLSMFGHCRELRTVRAAQSALRELPVLPSAQWLDLTGCEQVISIAGLRNSPLKEIYLRGTSVTDLTPLDGVGGLVVSLDEDLLSRDRIKLPASSSTWDFT